MADTHNTDPKKRARRRLVGAIALALLAALILPAVMDDEPVALVHDIQVSIPDSEDGGFRSRPIMGRSEVPKSVDEYPLEADVEDVVELSAPAVSTQAPQMPEHTVPDTAPVISPPLSAPVDPRPATPSQDLDSEAARVKAILDGKAGLRSSIGPGFMVQVGAFSEHEKADALRRELAQKGFPVVVETSGGINRVRVGPFSTRADAERGEARLSALGRAGVVIAR